MARFGDKALPIIVPRGSDTDLHKPGSPIGEKAVGSLVFGTVTMSGIMLSFLRLGVGIVLISTALCTVRIFGRGVD